MALYEYRCPSGHTIERIRKYDARHNVVVCVCGAEATLIISRSHVAPDGVYSYSPNLGSATEFERREQAIKDGVKVQPKLETPFPIGS